MPHTHSAPMLDADSSLNSMECGGHSVSDTRRNTDARQLADAASSSSICSVLAGLVIYTLVHASEANGAEPGKLRAEPPEPPNASALPLLSPAELVRAPETKNYSATEFRPRAASLLNDAAIANEPGENPALRSTTVWQRMSDFRSRDRVRVLTLWESGGGTVSLQAGKGGSPSLQWTSRSLSRGEATRGLLDRVFSASLASAGNNLRRPVRAAITPPVSAKPASLSVLGSETGAAFSSAAQSR
jgi:hypothetical protein